MSTMTCLASFRQHPGAEEPRWIKIRRLVDVSAALLVAAFFVPATAAGAVFNWPVTPAWIGDSPGIGASQTVDYSGSGQPVSVTIFNSGATWDTANGGPYPTVATGGTGFLNNGGTDNGLIIRALSETSNATYVQVTINFTNVGGANNVTFQLWDVDSTVTGGNNFIDKISNIQATAVGGGTVYADSVSNAHTNIPGTQFNIITGSGASLAIAGDPAVGGAANNSDSGLVTIGFSQTVQSITFQWSNSADPMNGGLLQQTVGIGLINFTPVPEVGVAAGALILCGGLLVVGRVRRRDAHSSGGVPATSFRAKVS